MWRGYLQGLLNALVCVVYVTGFTRHKRERSKMKKAVLICAIVAFAHQANAGVVFNITESGGNVVLEMSGSIRTEALGSFQSTFGTFDGFSASGGNVAVVGSLVETFNTNSTPWTPFGTGGFGQWDTSSGDAFAMFSNPSIGLPIGYISGSALSATAQKNNATFASLGFDVGSYVTVLTNGSNTDTALQRNDHPVESLLLR